MKMSFVITKLGHSKSNLLTFFLPVEKAPGQKMILKSLQLISGEKRPFYMFFF